MLQSNVTVEEIIETAKQYGRFYCKFLAANDLGSHDKSNQAGIYISSKAGPLFFEGKRTKDELLTKTIKIFLPYQDQPIESMAKWYGSKMEHRITRFWSKTEYNRLEQYGNFLVLIKSDEDTFICHILEEQDDIDTFISYFNINLVKNNEVYGVEEGKPVITKTGADILKEELHKEILGYSTSLEDFPATIEIALKAREYYFRFLNGTLDKPDNTLLGWINMEYDIFRAIEKQIYKEYLITPFREMDTLINFANTALNRRKSRAGKSFEHHIDFLLSQFHIPFSHPGVSEGKKKPDFLLPSNTAYADKSFPEERLIFLGAKTTCKDRWRQILNEAARTPTKFLITMQQGITANQLEEMKEHKVVLVVPQSFHTLYPKEHRGDLLSVNTFIQFLQEKYAV